MSALAQEDEGEEGDASTDELCLNRPADEYFRLSTEGDCREVVRYVIKFSFLDNIRYDVQNTRLDYFALALTFLPLFLGMKPLDFIRRNLY